MKDRFNWERLGARPAFLGAGRVSRPEGTKVPKADATINPPPGTGFVISVLWQPETSWPASIQSGREAGSKRRPFGRSSKIPNLTEIPCAL